MRLRICDGISYPCLISEDVVLGGRGAFFLAGQYEFCISNRSFPVVDWDVSR